MGATPIYQFPWPELPEVADGPDGFQDLELAMEGVFTKAWQEIQWVQNSAAGVQLVNNQMTRIGPPQGMTILKSGWVHVRAICDVQLNSSGFCQIQFAALPPSYDRCFDQPGGSGGGGRWSLGPEGLWYVPAGPWTVQCEGSVFSSPATVNGITWVVTAQGGIVQGGGLLRPGDEGGRTSELVEWVQIEQPVEEEELTAEEWVARLPVEVPDVDQHAPTEKKLI